MSLQSRVTDRVWDAIRNSYEGANYTGAILDSFYLLSDVIRDKSGLGTDGVQLVGAAFGGANPPIKLNAGNTQSDKDIQAGTEHLLRGLYLSVRNPRSHGKYEDTRERADQLIPFIDSIISQIDHSASRYDPDAVLGKIFDRYFANTTEYVRVLTDQIPPRRRLDLLRQVLQKREDGAIDNVVRFCGFAVTTLTHDERKAYYAALSDCLETANSDKEFTTAIKLATASWSELTDVARLRTENRVIIDIMGGLVGGRREAKGWCPSNLG
jgi:uncharacterized protein (TIGR02391 family)